MEKLEIKNENLKFLLKILLAALFIFFSVYIVLELEWQRGQFVYFFFKTRMYYGQYNKIVFPIYYWAFLSLICLIGIRLDPKKNIKEHVWEYLKLGFCFHIFLLLISKSEETLLDFTLTPLFFKSPPYGFIYEQFFFFLVFIFYYFFVARVIETLKNFSNVNEITTPVLIAAFSLLVAPFLVKNKLIHFGYIGFGFGLSFLAKYFFNSEFKEVCRQSFIVKKIPIITIIVLSIFYRIWYAGYFVSLGDKALGIGADGPAYYQAAVSFSQWDLKNVDFWFSPLYALYLSFFLYLFGKDIGTVFYCQALVGACAPVIIYFAAKKLWGDRVGFFSGVLVAISHLCIHYSVVINRASLLSVIFPLILLFYLKVRQEPTRLTLILIGFLFSSSFYIGPESLLAVLGVLTLLTLKHRQVIPLGGMIKFGKWVVLGVLIVVLPVNLISFSANDRLILLGRDSNEAKIASSTFVYSSSPSALKMKEIGFEPVGNIGSSIKIFLKYPWEITTLLLGKLKEEIPGFLFDPGGRFLMPLHLTLDSYYGANLQFYIYFLIILGVLFFITDKNIVWINKALILSLIILYGLFSSLVVMGTFRFRVTITPISMVFIAIALNNIFIKLKVPTKKNETIKNNFVKIFKSFYLKFGLGLFFLGSFMIISNYVQSFSRDHETLKLTRWNTFVGEIVETDILTINSNVFVHYDFKRIDLNKRSNFRFTFKICRDLMPGRKLYYRIFFDGSFIGPAKELSSGCSEVIEAFDPKYSKGVIGMVAFISDDGEISDPVPLLIKETGIKPREIVIPVIQNMDNFENDDLKDFNDLFLKYSRGLIKISKPEIWFDS